MNQISKLAGLSLLCGLGLSSVNAAIIRVNADISANTTWFTGNEYVLEGSVANQGVIRVTSGATLTIQQGVIVRGQPRTDAATYDAGSLLVARGSRILVQGTQGNPVIFTTAAVDNDVNGEPDGFTRNGLPGSGASASVFANRYQFDGAGNPVAGQTFWDSAPLTSPRCLTVIGLWGGVVLLGSAPTNFAEDGDAASLSIPAANPGSPTSYAYTEPVIEGLNTADPLNRYGGTDPLDNSGSITFASIRHGGIQLAADNEINGLTLGGVGAGTTINNVEVYGNEDDGIELFGGTVNLRNIVIASTKDDGLDIDQGYQGNVQFALVIGGSYADKLLEWDGDDTTEAAPKAVKANHEPRGRLALYNGTFIGGPTVNTSTSAGVLAQIRNNAAPRLFNSIFTNFTAGPNNVSNLFTIQGTSAFNYIFRNVTASGTNSLNANAVTTGQGNAISTASPGFLGFTFTACGIAGDTAGLQRPNFVNPRPAQSGGSPAAYLLSGSEQAVPPQFFQQVGYRGAFSNSAGVNPWTNNWTALNRAGIIPTL